MKTVPSKQTCFARLPSVATLLTLPAIQQASTRFGRSLVVDAIRATLQEQRQRIAAAGVEEIDPLDLAPVTLAQTIVTRVMATIQPSLVQAVNGTGIILAAHLGRAPLSEAAVAALAQTGGYSAVKRANAPAESLSALPDLVARKLARVAGTEAALVVNNGAAALLLALHTLAQGQEIVVACNELLALGDDLRIIDLIGLANARTVAVGTTNKVYLRDYEQHLGPASGALLKITAVNYAILGFTHTTPVEELVQLGQKAGLPVILDLGMGLPVALGDGLLLPYQLRPWLESGVTVVTLSGDKLLAGPSCGLILGQQADLERMAVNPLYRTLRCGKVVLTALEATLNLFLRPERLSASHPLVAMIQAPLTTLEKRGKRLINRLQNELRDRVRLELATASACLWHPAVPAATLPSLVVHVLPLNTSAETLDERLRCYDPAIFCTTKGERLTINLRTITDDQVETVARGIVWALSEL